jgi:glycosyltransferase involved in cell wall biosynthesis
VVFVLPYFDGGGAQRAALNFLRGLDLTRFAPTVVVFDATGPLRDLVPEEVPVHSLGVGRLRRALPRLIALLRRLRPEVIFSTFGYINLAVLAAAPLLRPRPAVIIREPNTPSASLPNLAYTGVLRLGYRMLYRTADAIICQSDAMADELRRDFRVPDHLIVRIANPIDVDAVRLAAGRPMREPGGGRRFLAAGRLTHQKAFDDLIRLFRNVAPDARLLVLGDGPEHGRLADLIKASDLSDRIRIGEFDPAPWRWFAGADAFLLPSRWEGMPNAALEALACGTPVIATPQSGGLLEVAREAPDGAVSIAGMGDDFLAAIERVEARTARSLRPCLLPQRFHTEVVARAFAALIDRRGAV